MKQKKAVLNFAIIFIIILTSINTIGLAIMYSYVDFNTKELNHIKSTYIEKMTIDNDETISSDDVLIDYYKYMDQKTNDSISRLLFIFSIFAGIFSIFTILISLKAPHEINKRIDEINNVLTEINIKSNKAKYSAEISSALSKKTYYDKIKAIEKLIRRYPEYCDAHMELGFMYDEVNKYDLAITHYKIAKKLGATKESYHNAMGVAYTNKSEYRKAVKCFTKAIKLDDEIADYYSNRGSCYHDMGMIEEALQDYNKAIDLDLECYEAYFNRNFLYEELYENEENMQKKIDYIILRMEDLLKSISINYEHEDSAELLKSMFIELKENELYYELVTNIDFIEIINRINDETEIDGLTQDLNPDIILAQIDELTGDIYVSEKNYTKAIDYYIKAYDSIEELNEDSNVVMTALNRISVKISYIVTEYNEDYIFNDTISQSLAARISSIAVIEYEDNKFDKAEILFKSLVDISDSARINLAYMIRRKETYRTTNRVKNLLDRCINKNVGAYVINRALCYIDGTFENNNWIKALEIVNELEEENIKGVINWWANKELVGESESNIVLLLLSACNKFKDELSIEERIKKAKLDGYEFPDEDIK